MQGTEPRVRLAHVEHLDRRHAAPVDTPRQLQPGQLQPRLRPRRRRARQQGRAAIPGPAAGDGARVVAGIALLLVGGVVLLVDHDQAEVADGSEDGRARPDADARLAAAQPPPLVVALARGEGRVEHREAIAQPRPKAGHRLRGEADLRHQDDRPPAAGESGLDRSQVDLGLAGAGDAVQEQLPRHPGFAVERGDDLGDGALLLVEEPRPAGRGRQLGAAGAAVHARAAGRDQAALLQAAEDLAVGADRGRQLAGRHLGAAQGLQHSPLLGAQPAPSGQRLLARGRDLGPQLVPRAHPLAAAAGAGRQDQLQAARGGRAVLPGDPEPEADQLRRDAGLERFERLGETLGRQLRGLRQPDDDAQRPPPPERHSHDAAHLEVGHLLRQPIVERPAQGTGGRQRLDLGDHSITVWRDADGAERGSMLTPKRWRPSISAPASS